MNTTLADRTREAVWVLGFPVDRVDMDAALLRCKHFVESDRPNVIITADASGLVTACGDSEFAEIIRHADLVTPDSYGVVWAASKVGNPVPERVSGVDLMGRLCAVSREWGSRIFLLGAAPGIAELAATRIREQYPGCRIVGTRHGYFDSGMDATVAAEVAEAKPDILFVAMGIPRQEKFIWATKDTIQAKVAVGVGGSFDVFSGTVKRAPRIIQKLRLEWLWRTLANPKKIAKAKNLPIFVWKVVFGRKVR